MKVEKKDLGKNSVELTIEVPVEELKPHLEKAAQKMSQASKIPGFRPGKAPYDLVKTRFGEAAIYQEALEMIVNASFVSAIQQEKLISVGQPEISVQKLAPGNPVIYKATVALLPAVTLGNWQEKKIKREKITVEQADVDQTLTQLREMRAQEKIVDRPAKNNDKIEIDFSVLINNVPIEGGTNHKYGVLLGAGRMIPGFEEKLLGAKAGDQTEFDLAFPEKYMQENLANKLAHFKVKVLGVYDRLLPEINDQFAKDLGLTDAVTLKKQISDNIKKDKEQKEEQRLEKAAIEQIVDTATIGELPEKLIDGEIHKMIHELEHSIQHQGMDLAGYLKSIKKTREDLPRDFRPAAITRLKAALTLRQLAISEKILVSEQEIDQEIAKQLAEYGDSAERKKEISSPTNRQHVGNWLANQKIIKFISDKIIN